MGIPKFYRWVSERYPLIIQNVKDAVTVPEVDNLYLDMNGIIHSCTHPNDGTVVEMSEAQMMLGIFRYIERVFATVRPKKMMFMAIDGCAPRAKMNQQRSRRFRAADDMKRALQEAHSRGEEAVENPFDSNCITPGTSFMARLGEHLTYWLRRKVAEDELWAVPEVVLSGPDVPGEGEHKIMEYIRAAKMQPGYNPNTRHCMLGNDADLIMLALCSHEPHFILLREKTVFHMGRKNPNKADNHAKLAMPDFQLLHLGLLRDYMMIEFLPIKDKLRMPFDFERIIDDWVLLAYFVGNDFLPHLPCLDIAQGAIQWLVDVYCSLVVKWDDYLTDNGDISLSRLQDFFKSLAKYEERAFTQLEEQRRNLDHKARHIDAIGSGRANSGAVFGKLDGEVDTTGLLEEGDDTDDDDNALAEEGFTLVRGKRGDGSDGDAPEGLFPAWQRRYYKNKLALDMDDAAGHQQLRYKYIEGILWCYHYYFHGVASWGWFYPYHYAPLVTDLVDLEDMNFQFHKGQPFTPYQQLLAVLPAASGSLLPEPYRNLMTNDSSQLKMFYPDKFDIDSEGKKYPWEGVVLIPFIEESLLVQEYNKVDKSALSSFEKRKDTLGTPTLFYRSADNLTPLQSTLPDVLPNLQMCSGNAQPFKMPMLLPGQRCLAKLLPGALTGPNMLPGYPSLHSIQSMRWSSRIEAAGVNVHGMVTKKPSVMLYFQEISGADSVNNVMQALGLKIGQRVMVNWPFWREARILSVADFSGFVGGAVQVKDDRADARIDFNNANNYMCNLLRTRSGIIIKDINVIIRVKCFSGMTRGEDGALNKAYEGDEVQVPLHLLKIPKESDVDQRFVEIAEYSSVSSNTDELVKSLKARFPSGSVGVLSAGAKKHIGKVCRVEDVTKDGQLRVSVQADAEVDSGPQWVQPILSKEQGRWQPITILLQRFGMPFWAMNRVLGSCRIQCGSEAVEVGLQIAFDSRESKLAIPGYCRFDQEKNMWFLSPKAVALVVEYSKQGVVPGGWFKGVVGAQGAKRYDPLDAEKLFSLKKGTANSDGKIAAQALQNWVKHQEISKMQLADASGSALSADGIKQLEKQADSRRKQVTGTGRMSMLVRPSHVILPTTAVMDSSDGQQSAIVLGDRVVHIAQTGSAPFGARGTVVLVPQSLSKHGGIDILFDDAFAEGTTLGGRCSLCRGLVLQPSMLLNMSAVERAAAQGTRQAKKVAAAPSQAPGPHRLAHPPAQLSVRMAIPPMPAVGPMPIMARPPVPVPLQVQPPVPMPAVTQAKLSNQGDGEKSQQKDQNKNSHSKSSMAATPSPDDLPTPNFEPRQQSASQKKQKKKSKRNVDDSKAQVQPPAAAPKAPSVPVQMNPMAPAMGMMQPGPGHIAPNAMPVPMPVPAPHGMAAYMMAGMPVPAPAGPPMGVPVQSQPVQQQAAVPNAKKNSRRVRGRALDNLVSRVESASLEEGKPSGQ